jgi:hypothetical protein
MFEPVDEELLPDERSPEFELEAAVSQTRLEQALAEIPPMTRAVLILKFRRCGCSFQENGLTASSQWLI